MDRSTIQYAEDKWPTFVDVYLARQLKISKQAEQSDLVAEIFFDEEPSKYKIVNMITRNSKAKQSTKVGHLSSAY